MNRRVLCVDDEPKVLSALRRGLTGDFDLVLAEGAEQALAALDGGADFAVCLSDMRMPGMNGIELLGVLRERCPDTVRMMLTGNADLETATGAVNEGEVFRYLTKPCAPEVLRAALEAGIEQHRLIRAERELLSETLNGCVKVLVEVLSLVAPASFQRLSALKETAGEVARKLELEKPWEVEVAFMLSQLGLITLPPDLLQRRRAGEELTAEESLLHARVPEFGANLIQAIPRMDGVAAIIRAQRAAYDPAARDDEAQTAAQILRTILEYHDLVEGGARRGEALRTLASRSGAYDPRILEALLAASAALDPGAEELAPIAIAFDDLRPGHVLAAPIETADGRCVVREGHRIGHVLLQRLRNHRRAAGLKEPLFIMNPKRAEAEAA